jgi:hypothetical protein
MMVPSVLNTDKALAKQFFLWLLQFLVPIKTRETLSHCIAPSFLHQEEEVYHFFPQALFMINLI